MAENRQYDHEYKVQAVKLAKEIGQAKAAKELGIPKNTMYSWVRAVSYTHLLAISSISERATEHPVYFSRKIVILLANSIARGLSVTVFS